MPPHSPTLCPTGPLVAPFTCTDVPIYRTQNATITHLNAKSCATSTQMQSLKLLHQVLPHSPHPRSLAIDVHWDGRKQTGDLDPPNGDKDILRAVGFEPLVEEEGEDEAVENV